MTEMSKIKRDVVKFTNEISFKINALESIYKNVSAQLHEVSVSLEPVLASPSKELETVEAMETDSTQDQCVEVSKGENKEFNLLLKNRRNKWKEGEDHCIWPKIMCLGVAKCGCVFLVDPEEQCLFGIHQS